MTPLAIALSLLAVVAVATGLGVLLRASSGRVKQTDASIDIKTLVELGVIENGAIKRDAGKATPITLLQFSTTVCAPCKATHRLLDELVSSRAHLQHVDLDVTKRPDLAARFHILQTPTTLVIDRNGVVRARIGGTPKRAGLDTEIDRLLGAP